MNINWQYILIIIILVVISGGLWLLTQEEVPLVGETIETKNGDNFFVILDSKDNNKKGRGFINQNIY